MSINDANLFRSNIVKKIANIIGKKYSVNIEKGIYNHAVKIAKKKKIVRKWENKIFVILYKNRLKMIITNLKHDKVKKRILSGDMSVKDLSNATHLELLPNKWKKLMDAKLKRDESLTSTNLSAATDEFKCYKCKKRKCTYYQLQTRSADEPMTTFVSCLVCGNRWKC